MNVEIITIGDELLSGHTLDSNAAYIAQSLAGVGLEVKYKSSVGDTIDSMEEAFRLALKRARIVITTGGLGPTDDDLTKRAIVKVFKRNLIFHEEVLNDIKARFEKRGITMPPITQNQALLPQGGKFFPNKFGSAVGICIAEQGRVFISLPGVPSEMRQLMADSVIPYLSGLQNNNAIEVISIRTTGTGETKLAELLKPTLKLPSGVKLAYLPSYSGVTLRVTAMAGTPDEARENAAQTVKQLESSCGRYIYGYGNDNLETVIGQLLRDNDKTLAVAESCTGGQLGMLITSVAGSSSFFLGGVIAYADEVKINSLSVDKTIIDEHGAVSEECAKAMAAGARKSLASDYALSITGIAGPDGGSDNKPVGLTYIGLASAHANQVHRYVFGTDRKINRERAAYTALEILRREILDIS